MLSTVHIPDCDGCVLIVTTVTWSGGSTHKFWMPLLLEITENEKLTNFYMYEWIVPMYMYMYVGRWYSTLFMAHEAVVVWLIAQQ